MKYFENSLRLYIYCCVCYMFCVSLEDEIKFIFLYHINGISEDLSFYSARPFFFSFILVHRLNNTLSVNNMTFWIYI